MVRYAAADGRFKEKVVASGVRCNDAVYGDPASGFAKQCFIKNPSNPNNSNPTESSAFKVVELLIANGANATSPEYIISACKSANVPLATLLLNNNAPKDAIDELGQPLVHIAALTWNTDIVTAILALGVNPNAKNRAGDTALHIVGDDAASKGYPKFEKKKRDRIPMINALIAGKADVNAIDAKGDFVLKRSNDDYIKDLLKAAGAVKDQKELDKKKLQ